MKSLTSKILSLTTLLSTATFATCGLAQDNSSGYFLRPVIGYSSLSDQTGQAQNTGFENGTIDVDLSGGIVAGLGWGYRYNEQFSAELYWEYRSNDSDTTFADSGNTFSGNYASNTFYLNGYYHFPQSPQNWSFYAGAGLGISQEIDLDIEQGGQERSASGSGDFGFQVMAGADYVLNKNWIFNTEIRYSSFSSIELEGEEGLTGTLNNLDYDPITVGFGVKYLF